MAMSMAVTLGKKASTKKDGVDRRKATIAGVSFWVGTGFQNQCIYPDLLGDGFLGVLLGNGMTSGAIVAIIMMLFMELTAPRRRSLQAPLDEDTLSKLTEFLRTFDSRGGWSRPATDRLLLVGEETVASMLGDDGQDVEPDGKRRLVVTARKQGSGAELEFVSAAEEDNLEDQLASGGASGCPGRARNLLPPAATLRIIGASPEVPRGG